MRLSLVQFRWMQRGRLPSKHGNKQYYKGNNTGSMGEHRKGFFYINPMKVRNWIIPDLTGCELKPYVSHTVNKTLAREKAVVTVQDFIDQAVKHA